MIQPFSAEGNGSVPFMSPKGCFLCLPAESDAVNPDCQDPTQIVRRLVMLMLWRRPRGIGRDTTVQARWVCRAPLRMGEIGTGWKKASA